MSKEWIPRANTHYGRLLCHFVDDKAVTWGKGTKLSNDNPFPAQGFTALLIACVAKDRAAGRKVDKDLARYVERVSGVGVLNGNTR